MRSCWFVGFVAWCLAADFLFGFGLVVVVVAGWVLFRLYFSLFWVGRFRLLLVCYDTL